MITVKVLIKNNKTQENEYIQLAGLYTDEEILETITDDIIDKGWCISDCEWEIYDDLF